MFYESRPTSSIVFSLTKNIQLVFRFTLMTLKVPGNYQSIFMKKKFLICNKASFTEQDCVKESKIGLHLRKLKTNELSAHVYIE